jgi:hypothetical protein
MKTPTKRQQKMPRLTGRFVMAVDSEGVHFRKTLCVTHNDNTGEARYDTKPICSRTFQEAEVVLNALGIKKK